jgi:hypothetical protein
VRRVSNKIKIGLQISLCFLTVASLAVTTFAWFTTQAVATVSFWEMHVAAGLKFEIKYYTGNYSDKTSSFSGYDDPRVTGRGGTIARTVKSYSGVNPEFVPIKKAETVDEGVFEVGGPLDISHLSPGYCHTYSVEITSDFATDQNVELRLAKFVGNESTKNVIFGSDPLRGISLASAMDIYSKGYALSATDSVNAASATDFINTYMQSNPVDHFDYDDVIHGVPDGGYQLFQGVAPANSSFVFFFTIEFTNLPNTFYVKAKSDDTYDYWTKSVSGDSNAYQNLTFAINTLYINNLSST